MPTPPDFTNGTALEASSLNAVGLWLVKTVTVGTAVTSVPVTNCFSNAYSTYRIIISGVSVSLAGNSSFIKLNNTSGNTNIGSGYFGTLASGAASVTPARVGSFEGLWIGVHGGRFSAAVDIHNPHETIPTTYDGGSVAGSATGFVNKFDGVDTNPVSHTGFEMNIATGSPGHNYTGGTIRVYGYRN